MKNKHSSIHPASLHEEVLFESDGVLHLSSTRWLLLIMGCVVPEVGGAFLVLHLFPYISVILLGSAIATLGFLLTVLKKQRCRVKLYSDRIEFLTARGAQSHLRSHIKDLQLVRGNQTGLLFLLRDEVQFFEVKNPERLIEVFKRDPK